MTNTPSQREIFSETGSVSASSEGETNTDTERSGEATASIGSESIKEEARSEPSHYSSSTASQNEIYNSGSYSTTTSSQSEIFSKINCNPEYDANSESVYGYYVDHSECNTNINVNPLPLHIDMDIADVPVASTCN